MSTMPKVTVADGSEVNGDSYPDLADLESGVRDVGHNQEIEMQQVNPTAV